MILLVRFIGNVAAIWVASKLLDGVTYGGEWFATGRLRLTNARVRFMVIAMCRPA